ncbi:tripartite tricarboxylate transporter TctB family protein (plasmid) [Azospirillum argentinense]|uniref:Tripartite tricarboxylate transporter TctB family protein n=1 Tax=Azospirillum argentinense TaxID=2970906 RepID=A0A4D8PRG1_9PROT|nr:tripartite tricarboxylate transporter TctB family protein [Azospirillum argentinense]QCN98408.1 tripartite tricarboxylate transporter TctB family protein [Azospirillum argentinense]
MASNIRRTEELASGLALAALGAAAGAFIVASYPLGTARQLGPGAMPALVALILVLLGGVIAVRGLWEQGEGVGDGPGNGAGLDLRAALRPAGLILGAILLFGGLVDWLGVVPASAIAVIGSALASRRTRKREIAALAAVLAVAVPALFVGILGMPLKIWPAL